MVRLTGKTLGIDDVVAVARHGAKVALAQAALRRVGRSHAFIVRVASTQVIYGVNTGFGPMADRAVEPEQLEALQRNLVRSHACGAGAEMPREVVRAAMLARLNTLLRGDSGVSVELVRRLARLLNEDCLPVLYERGGVGASGDLIQLAHMALGLIGEGYVYLRGRRMSARAAHKALRLSPLVLGPKEGLALINGTSCMTGVAALAVFDASNVIGATVRASAVALEAAEAFADSLAPALHAARPHRGQGEVAVLLRSLVRGSKKIRTRGEFQRLKPSGARLSRLAQDVYSLRCAPQIVGPALETLREVRRVVEIELNSATDNPLIDTAHGEVMHGGNFHGEYVAAGMDKLKAAVTKLALMSERRLNFFLHEKLNGLYPPFLNVSRPGLTLGLQGVQFVATSTTALCQTLSYPHALHSISTNADNQDVVSMGADAAVIARTVVAHTALVCAIELVALSQAAALRPAGLSAQGKSLVRRVRAIVAPVNTDRPLFEDIQKLAEAVRLGEFSLTL